MATTDLAKEERNEGKELLRKLASVWRDNPLELPPVHLELDDAPQVDAPTLRVRKPKTKTLSRARSTLEEDDEDSAPMTASQEARRTLKFPSPTKGWIELDAKNADKLDGDDDEGAAAAETSSSPPTSFLPAPVTPPRVQHMSSSSSLPPSVSSAKPQVGSWISKGASPLSSSPSPAKKARTSRSRNSSAKLKQISKALSEEKVEEKLYDPETPNRRATRAESMFKPTKETPKKPEKQATRPVRKSRSTRKAGSDLDHEDNDNFAEDGSVEEKDDLLYDAAEVVAAEEKVVIKKLLKKDKVLRELYL